MPRVKDVIEHILHHVNAEAATSDASQAPGVQGRATLVRLSVDTLKSDNRNIPINDILLEIHNLAPSHSDRSSFRRTITNIINSNIPRPRLAIQAWVRDIEEKRG